MKKTRKLYALILAGVLCLSLAACGGGATTNEEETAQTENEEEVAQTENETAEDTDEAPVESEEASEEATEVKADAETMRALFLECVGFGDTSDPAVQEAQAAYDLVSCAQALQIVDFDEDAVTELRTAIYEAYQSLDDAQKAEFDVNFAESLNGLANDAVQDYQSVADLFENAGLGDEMSALVSQDNVEVNWTTLGAYIVTRNAMAPAVEEAAEENADDADAGEESGEETEETADAESADAGEIDAE